MPLNTKYIADELEDIIVELSEFLHRFLHAANSHVELERFIMEGEELLRSIEE